MSISRGIIEWLNTCPQIQMLDMSQTMPDAEGLYKQPAVTVQELIDGSALVTQNYYILFQRDAQISKDRFTNEEILEAVEEWIREQDWNENYPDIGHEVYRVGISNSYYMLSRENDQATYQATLEIRFLKEVQSND